MSDKTLRERLENTNNGAKPWPESSVKKVDYFVEWEIERGKFQTETLRNSKLQSQVERIQAELASVTAGKVTIVKEKFYPADKELIEQLQAENARLLEALQNIADCKDAPDIDATGYWQFGLHCGVEDRYCQDRYQGADYGHTVGVEKALEWACNESRAALASIDSSNWLQEQKAQWREEIETKHAKSCDGNYIAGMRHGWNLCVNNNDEGFAKAIRLRRMAEQPESK